MRMMAKLSCLCVFLAMFVTGCKQQSKTKAPAAAPAASALHIRPDGDQTIHPDMSKIDPALAKVFTYIDAHIDEHAENMQKWIQQPSISNTGEGIPESAEMVKGFFDKLGCQQSRVYDVGLTEYGTPGNPVVFAKCDEGAPKTLVIYWMYDTMPVTQPDVWLSPPFEARILPGKDVGLPKYPKVLMGRGAVNTKGPQMAQLNAIMSMKAVLGKLPVNLMFIAEGDEERMDIGLRKFMRDHSDLLKGADAMFGFGGSEGCVYVELTTSGKSWGRGPLDSDIHGSNKRRVDSPAWRHIKMLSSLVSDDGNTPLIKGFYDNMEPLTESEKEVLKARAAKINLKDAAANLGVARFIKDDALGMLTQGQYGTSFNLDGLWGGNMFAGGAGAILPNKVTSKHNIRYVPNMDGVDLVKKLRAQLDHNGYKDVEVKLIGDVPWAKVSHDSDIAKATDQMRDQFGLSKQDHPDRASILGGYWPAYLFTDGPTGQKIGNISIPIGGGQVGTGDRSHAANEFYVIEGADKTYGLAGDEKSVATLLWDYAHTTTKKP